MSLKNKSSDLNFKCEEENAHDDPRNSPIFLKYAMKQEKLMASLNCEENGIYNDLSCETKYFKYKRKQINYEENGLNGEGFESNSDGVCIKADKAVDNEDINDSANTNDANAQDANAQDANAEDDNANATINKKAPDEDVENQLTDLLKTIKVESRKVGRIKLIRRWASLEKLISGLCIPLVTSHGIVSSWCTGLGGPPWSLRTKRRRS